jgi:serine/threonine-protein kinase HipA
MRAAQVLLGDAIVGELVDTDEVIAFRFADSYQSAMSRPVLSQYFEDDLGKVYRGKKGNLPVFFANLIPEEGPLRSFLEGKLDVNAGDDFGLLLKVGRDLPGAVTVVETEGISSLMIDGQTEEDADHEEDNGTSGLRFSLAGVQLKFSMSRVGDRLTLPASGERGEWIVKLPSVDYPNLAKNEFAIMEWARASGFDVPECTLESAAALPASIRAEVPEAENVFAVRRYDRLAGKRIHQEDFAQVINALPKHKYEFTYEKCAVLLHAICDLEGYYEFVRRLVFVVASGNCDAHLKNWSLLYPDGVRAELTPLYDQVSTIAWPKVKKELALKLTGSRSLGSVTLDSFRHLATKVGVDINATVDLVADTLDAIKAAWRIDGISGRLPNEHRDAVIKHWETVPLLRTNGPLII